MSVIDLDTYSLPFIAVVDLTDVYGVKALILPTETFKQSKNQYFSRPTQKLYAVSVRAKKQAALELVDLFHGQLTEFVGTPEDESRDLLSLLAEWVEVHVDRHRTFPDVNFEVEVLA